MLKNTWPRLLLLVGLAFTLAACATALAPAPVVQKPAERNIAEQQPAEPAAPPLDYDGMVARSLVSAGNNVRLKAAVARARAGRDVTLAFIGGSVTEGAGAAGNANNYVSLAGEAFKTLFGAGTALNAGMSGTASDQGLLRYRRDVVERRNGANPDVVFIEFAVNDADDRTGGAAFESLVRDILGAKNKPAVVLLFAVFRSHWNLQEKYLPVGRAYGLPMISIKDAVVPELRSKALAAKQFFADEYHPTNYGHKFMADCIVHLFKTADAAPADAKDAALPAKAVIGKQFQGMQMIDAAHLPAGVAVKTGGFTENDPGVWTFMNPPRAKAFPANWHKKDPNANEPFTMTLTCKNLLIVTKLSSSAAYGTAEVAIDGKVVKTIKGRDPGGWNNSVTALLIDADKAARHVVTVKMADDSAAKAFSILAFGFTR